MNDYDRKYVTDFFADIALWSDAFVSIGVSYIAFKNEDEYVLSKARLFLEAWPRELRQSQYQYESLQAGVFFLSELDVSLKSFQEALERGEFLFPNGILPFGQGNDGSYSAYYDPYVSEGVEGNYRLSLLQIMGGIHRPRQHQTIIDWELKSGKKPFDNMNALLAELGLGALNADRAIVEFVAFNCLMPQMAEAHGNISGTEAHPALILASGLDTTKVALGYQVYHQGKVVERNRLEGSDLQWEAIERGNQGCMKISVPPGAVIQCFGSYAGSTHFQWFLNDPQTVQNPLRAAYNTFDTNLEILEEFLTKGPGKGNARDLESAVSWLLWMLGFQVTHLGATPKNQEAPDLIAATSLGHFLVIECTTDLLKADNKLPKLISRTEALRRNLNASGSQHLKVLPVIISSKTSEEVAADIEQAERLGVLVVTREDLLQFVERSLVLPNAIHYFNEAEKKVSEAKRKFSKETPF